MFVGPSCPAAVFCSLTCIPHSGRVHIFNCVLFNHNQASWGLSLRVVTDMVPPEA